MNPQAIAKLHLNIHPMLARLGASRARIGAFMPHDLKERTGGAITRLCFHPQR
jgi:hypothetical protein